MTMPTIVLVEDTTKHARLLTERLQQHGLLRPVHFVTGEDAVVWISTHPCDVCVLDYDLPGIDGFETLARLHQRKPDLPVIMVSSAPSPQVAIRAFHAGVVDYVPKQPGFDTSVVAQILWLTHADTARTQRVQPVTNSAIPAQLLRPTYQNRLRVIGRQLDIYGYHAVSVLEVGGGFLVRAMAPEQRTPEALEFPDRDFPQLVTTAFAMRGEETRHRAQSALLPMGYEDMLRALGYHLDTHHAEAITVTELPEFIAVGGIGLVDGVAQSGPVPFQLLWHAPQIADLVDAAHQRRATRPSAFNRLLGHRSS